MVIARGKVQFKVGGFKSDRNPKSVEAQRKHGDIQGVQLGVAGSGIKRRKR